MIAAARTNVVYCWQFRRSLREGWQAGVPRMPDMALEPAELGELLAAHHIPALIDADQRILAARCWGQQQRTRPDSGPHARGCTAAV